MNITAYSIPAEHRSGGRQELSGCPCRRTEARAVETSAARWIRSAPTAVLTELTAPIGVPAVRVTATEHQRVGCPVAPNSTARASRTSLPS